jgi:hypothetical protein
LDKYLHLHDVFPVQLLKDYYRHENNEVEVKGPLPDLLEEQEEWEVQEIHDAWEFDGVLHYLVKWTGWPSEYDSWEPTEHMIGAPKKIQEFKRARKWKWRNDGKDGNHSFS